MCTNNSPETADAKTLDKYTRSGAYKLTCPDCNKAYRKKLHRRV